MTHSAKVNPDALTFSWALLSLSLSLCLALETLQVLAQPRVQGFSIWVLLPLPVCGSFASRNQARVKCCSLPGAMIEHQMPFLAIIFFCWVASEGLTVASFVDDLPGWMGEIRTKVTTSSNLERNGGRDAFVVDPTKVVQLSWKPRAFLYQGFLSDGECEHLKKLAKSKLEKSMVADNESGKSVLSEIRTSSGMFIARGHDAIVNRIEQRIATWTFIPKEHGEALQVLRYQHGEKYEPHYDFFHDKLNQALGGHRIATVLMYLAEVTKGGETVFPNAPDPRVKNDSWSECAKKGLSVHPRKGDALLFFSLNTEAVPDIMSLHGSCPVIEGEKWSATKWMHVGPFERVGPKPVGCTDDNVRCVEWAAAGECKKNSAYMIGTDQYAGSCRKSCKVC